MQELFPEGVAGEDSAPNLHLSKLVEFSKTSRARKRIFGLHVNIDKASSRRGDVTRGSKDPQLAHQCCVYSMKLSSSSNVFS